MAKIRKFIKGLYQYGNLFKITNPTEVVGDSEVKQITPYRGVIQKQGDIITAEDHNEIQRNGVLFVSSEYSENYGVGVDAYVIKDYYNEQGIFDGLKLKFQIPRTNMYVSPVIILDGLKYNLKIINNNILENARKGELNKNEIVSVIFLNGSFVLETSKAGINSRGITSYGITEDTALEGNKWLETIGGQFGGYVSKVQNKEAGKLYINDVYDNKLYVCVTAHSSTSFDITKYRDITNNGISDQLKNLYNFAHNLKQFDIGRGAYVIKIGKICIMTWDSNNTIQGEFGRGAILLNVPEECRPVISISFPVAVWNSPNSATARLNTNGTVTWESSINYKGAVYANVSWITN